MNKATIKKALMNALLKSVLRDDHLAAHIADVIIAELGIEVAYVQNEYSGYFLVDEAKGEACVELGRFMAKQSAHHIEMVDGHRIGNTRVQLSAPVITKLPTWPATTAAKEE